MRNETDRLNSSRVARYYDRNTTRFLRYGGSHSAGAIHRQIWAPGVIDKEGALNYLNQLVAAEIEPVRALGEGKMKVLDLGCGVGGTATWLAGNLEVEVLGVTNSPIQQELAIRRATVLGLQQRCDFQTADFSRFSAPGPFAAVCMIEAFTHAEHPAGLLSSIHEWLLPGGRLVLADDFYSPGIAPDRSWLQQFRSGWHLNALMPVEELQALAGAAGFGQLKDEDLTPLIRVLPWTYLGPASLISRLPFSQVYWQNLRGGIALQVCIRRGWIRYHFMTWEKPLASPSRRSSGLRPEQE